MITNDESINQLLTRLMSSMNAVLGVQFNVENLGDWCASLHEYAMKHKRERETISEFSKFILSRVRDQVQEEGIVGDISRFVAAVMFADLIKGMGTFVSHRSAPKTHHWLPVVFLRCFGTGKKSHGGRKVRAVIPATVFHNGVGVGVEIADKEFTHKRGKDGNGFYHLAMESFFGITEGYYGLAWNRMDDPMSVVHLSVFFLTQTVRTPHPKFGFHVREISETTNLLVELVSQQGAMFVSMVESEEHIPFTPYIPERIHRVRGQDYACFPAAQDKAIVFSNQPLPAGIETYILEKHRDKIIHEAKRDNGIVYGVSIGG